MRLCEFTGAPGVTSDDVSTMKIKMVGLIRHLYGRIQDTGTTEPYKLTALLSMLGENGIHLSAEQFRDMVQEPPLSNMISNVRGNTVVFKGQRDEPDSDLEAPDETTDTLDRMAKRAADKRD
jgi:hypothetical protein